ncbi:MAG TPA: 7-cyano-7-deazaguanine synthase, partial [Oceanospirillales bacterium]|nr:7-cyano-7-deazaguanine synthase [Oceanospirillales bacterium]
WTCYNGREKACGKCGSCVERLEAFEKNHATDPLEYETV